MAAPIDENTPLAEDRGALALDGVRSIRWRGPFSLSESGYADESRCFVELLRKRGVEVETVEIERNGSVAGCSHRALHKPTLEVVSCPWGDFAMPSEDTYVVWRTMYETDRIPQQWVERTQLVDEVWVPSAFNLETFANAGVPRHKLVVLPAPIDVRRFAPDRAAGCANAPFTFLSIFRWQYRKGWDVLLRAYRAAFSTADDVRLVMQVMPLLPTASPPKVQVREVLGFEVESTATPIEIRTKPLRDSELPSLYNTADCFVLASRGEGAGRPYMEAMASALPTIGTRWSGNLAFMSDQSALLIDAEVRPVSDAAADEWPLFAGQRWAEPNEEHLAQLLRQVYESSKNERALLGRRARAAVERLNGIDVVETRLSAHLQRVSALVGC